MEIFTIIPVHYSGCPSCRLETTQHLQFITSNLYFLWTTPLSNNRTRCRRIHCFHLLTSHPAIIPTVHSYTTLCDKVNRGEEIPAVDWQERNGGMIDMNAQKHICTNCIISFYLLHTRTPALWLSGLCSARNDCAMCFLFFLLPYSWLMHRLASVCVRVCVCKYVWVYVCRKR